MVRKNELQYYELTLNNGASSMKIGDKEIPIIGVYVAEGEMRDVFAAKEIKPNLERKPTGDMSYIYCREVPRKEVKALEKLLFGLTVAERDMIQAEMDRMEHDIRDQHFLNSAFGVGDIMYRRLAINAQYKDDK